MTALALDGAYYLARLYVTRRKLEQAQAGECPIDDDTLMQLGKDLTMLGEKLRELCPPKSMTANVVRMTEWRQRKRGVTL